MLFKYFNIDRYVEKHFEKKLIYIEEKNRKHMVQCKIVDT